ncbi:MAG: hypothetical protein JETT_1618 [Candidatus Jettenia ecosi]|uniref:Uncharacterized protein n=1 Tax=Candidatus Jettenia ecosi TaxID=2494326 RepID=A0A533QBQ0_9BACT|nr:MAG: hypothetical protein JETT_1618 [Candidatus Jettenia ecosi]
MRHIEKTGIFPNAKVFINDAAIVERHGIVMERYHRSIEFEVGIVEWGLFHKV